MKYPILVLLTLIILFCSCGAAQTASPAPMSVIHNQPHLGDTLAAFTAFYGTPKYFPPSHTANPPHSLVPGSYLFVKDSIYINVTIDASKIVESVTIVGPDAWNSSQTKDYCKRFVPFHGKAQLTLYAPNAVVMTLSPSD